MSETSMLHEGTIRLNARTWTVWTLLLAGTLWAGWGAWTLLADPGYGCNSPSDLVADSLFAIAGMSLFVALVLISGRFRGAFRWIAIIGGVAAATMGIGNGIEHCGADFFVVAYVFGATAMFLSIVVLGISILVFGNLDRWLGLALIIGMIAFANANDTGGPILFGLAWALVALAIRRHALLSNNPASGA